MITMPDKVVLNEGAYDTVYGWGLEKEIHKVPLTQIKYPLPHFRMIFGENDDMFFDVTATASELQVVTVHQETNYILDYIHMETVNGVDMVSISDEYHEVFNYFNPGADYGSYCQDMAFFVTSLMVYMAEYREVKERIRKVNKISSSKKQNHKKRSKKSIKIGVYYINDYQPSSEKKERQKHVESWSVRGHWRNLRSGMRTWIAQHNKGSGAKEAKTYTLD